MTNSDWSLIKARNFLAEHGYRLTKQKKWIKPPGTQPTTKEWEAIHYLHKVHKYGEIVEPQNHKTITERLQEYANGPCIYPSHTVQWNLDGAGKITKTRGKLFEANGKRLL